jgi:hypothetical protein
VNTVQVSVWVLPIVAVLAGCVEKAAPTVEYYRSHADERQAQLSGCANDPGSSANDAACVNAREAERLESIGSLRNLPSLGLPGTPEAPGEPEKRRAP